MAGGWIRRRREHWTWGVWRTRNVTSYDYFVLGPLQSGVLEEIRFRMSSTGYFAVNAMLAIGGSAVAGADAMRGSVSIFDQGNWRPVVPTLGWYYRTSTYLGYNKVAFPLARVVRTGSNYVHIGHTTTSGAYHYIQVGACVVREVDEWVEAPPASGERVDDGDD